MTDRIVLMDFTGVYESQKFAGEITPVRLELRQLTGCSCYCDEEAAQALRRQIQMLPADGIHFLDSGNYHYMSLLWLEKIKVPFRLILFDNHTDMQPPAFGGLLSCGGWAAEALEKLPCLKEVILAGPDQEAFDQVDEKLRKRVRFLSREKMKELSLKEKTDFFETLSDDLPCYLSVDKDILCPGDASTSWSQGDMRLQELKECLRTIFGKQKILGMDVCGECDPDSCEDSLCNDRANQTFLGLYLAYEAEERAEDGK